MMIMKIVIINMDSVDAKAKMGNKPGQISYIRPSK